MNRILIRARSLIFKLKTRFHSGSLHRYEYLVDLADDSAPASVVRFVGQDRKVLEIGAGPGSITRFLSGKNRCHVTAAEVDDSAIEKLRQFCDRVIKLDLNAPNWTDSLQEEGLFEVVVIADVLEHLYDPWQVLQDAKRLLAPGGHLVVSLPHAAHCAIVACLIEGDFEYRDWGLLDRTHIRFFGMRNIQNLFDGAGLSIVDAHFVVKAPEQTELVAHWNNLPAPLRAMLALGPHAKVYQVVVKATAGSPALKLTELPVSTAM
ncbi:MAG: class I SAM-dependent methyltransferase [Candidatus Accumulibacter phosphatis]|uniref:Sarcosine/dimethylglycine N-methyltransferase n=2 Tax=Candidatus Accumulibacter TaxID=327159 RepID=A0A080M2B3_9PROT|nr:MAG: Sarcosine/dimethylglycine N-methyltransferase [Candidatus Accumulibacter phosphatis]